MIKLTPYLVTVCLWIGFSGDQVLAEQYKLKIKGPTIEIHDSLIRVSHVANIETHDRVMLARLGQLDLDEIQIGQTVELSKQQILMRVRLELVDSKSIEIQGPSKLRVTRVPIQQNVSQVRSLVRNAVSNQFGIASADVRVVIDENRVSAALANGVPASSTVILPTDLPLGKTKIRLLYLDSNGQQQELDLDCRISVVTEMLVATRNLNRGLELIANDFKVVRRPLADRRTVPASKQDLVGKRTTRLIPVHGIIKLSDLTRAIPRNLVSRNDRVDVIYRSGGMTARIRNAKVLTSGKKGDRVEVLNPDSNKRLVASVVSETLLEVR